MALQNSTLMMRLRPFCFLSLLFLHKHNYSFTHFLILQNHFYGNFYKPKMLSFFSELYQNHLHIFFFLFDDALVVILNVYFLLFYFAATKSLNNFPYSINLEKVIDLHFWSEVAEMPLGETLQVKHCQVLESFNTFNTFLPKNEIKSQFDISIMKVWFPTICLTIFWSFFFVCFFFQMIFIYFFDDWLFFAQNIAKH